MNQNLAHNSRQGKASKEAEEKQKAALAIEQKKMAELVQCAAVASSSPEGIITFRQLMIMCGYNMSAVAANPKTGEINVEGTIYNTARENIWKEFRQLIPVKTRKKIEYEKTVFTEEGGE